ncbi:DUF481 domain-containing protein [Spirosoma areae]
MKNRRLFLLLLGSLLFHYSSSAQIVEQPDPLRPSRPSPDSTLANAPIDSGSVDTDDLGHDEPDSTVALYRYKVTADGTITEGNVSRVLLQLAGAVDYTLSHSFKLSSNPSFVYGKQSGFLAEREWFGDLRTTFRHEKRLYYLAFGSYERSNLRQINHRWTAAAGLGYKLLNRTGTYISVTNVILHESTDFIERSDILIFRNSVRLFGEYAFGNNRWTLTHTAYYQPALGQYNVRWNASLSLQLKLTEVISLRSTVANAYESLVGPGRQNNDFRFTVGLAYERK